MSGAKLSIERDKAGRHDELTARLELSPTRGWDLYNAVLVAHDERLEIRVTLREVMVRRYDREVWRGTPDQLAEGLERLLHYDSAFALLESQKRGEK